MADAVVGALVTVLIDSIGDELSVKNFISLLKGFSVEKDVEKLVNVLSTIQDVLEDAEERQINNKPIEDWLRDLKDVTYYAEDVLDALHAWALKSQDDNQMEAATTSSTNIVSGSLPFTSGSFAFSINFEEIKRSRRKIAKQIQKVISKFEEVSLEKLQFRSELQFESQYSKEKETSLVASQPHMYGAEENVTKIIDILVNTFAADQDGVSVCPIVGMGGLGKTTLARSVYNDERVKKHFELKIWVCVSEPFDVLKAIIESVNQQACDLVTLDSVHKNIEEILRQKRYLLVLDDLCNEHQDQWEKLKRFLKAGAKGSSVVLTTRSLRVASITGAEPYRLGVLFDDDCFSLFKHHAVGARGEELHPNLVAIGKQIAKKCKGVPLVAKSLGSLLRFKNSERQWELVRDSDIWTLDETEENMVLAALRLSYNHLSWRLKQCFAYCAIFPKNFKMRKSQLINSWIANGFIHSQRKIELEKVGDDVFNELLRLSFFQEPETDEFVNTTTCKMHSLMHDLATTAAKNECFIEKVGETKDIPETIRHLSVVKSQTDVVNHLLSSPPSLRTLSFFHSIDFHRFQFSSTLRVLNLSNKYIETLPPSICDLIHLRYLDLSFNSLVSLPESIYNLRNLLMLDLSDNRELGALPLSLCKLLRLSYLNLSGCHSITSLPEGLGSMSSLRHLHNWDCYREMPVGIGQLTCLETLGWFVVGRLLDGDNEGGGARISELQGLNQLRGELNIRGLGNVRNGEDAKEADLSSKTHLTRLQLCWDWEKDVNNSKEVLEGLLWLPLNNNITSLEIGYYKGECFPEVLLQNLKSLKSLEIRWCSELVSLPEGLLQNLTSLEKLEIEYCYSLKSLGFKGTLRDSNPNTFSSSSSASSSSHFHSSSLQELDIWNCPQLLLSEEDFKNLDALRELTLNDLPQLTSLPQGIQHLPMLRRLRIWKCSNLRILPEWTKGREKEKGVDWCFYCHDPNIEFVPDDTNEPATEETGLVNNDENTIVELDGSATEAISDNQL